MTNYEDLKIELALVETKQDELFESIRPQADAFAADAKRIRDELSLLAVDRFESYTVDDLADPVVYLEASELLWNSGWGLELERELLSALFAGTYIYSSANFLEGYYGLPKHLMGFTVAIPAKSDPEKLALTAQVLAPLLKAAHEIDSERAVLTFLTDDEDFGASAKVTYGDGLFSLFDYGSAPRARASELVTILEKVPSFG